jgi:ABC-type nitrate/sulfonate/bicarbonate transport system permease component
MLIAVIVMIVVVCLGFGGVIITVISCAALLRGILQSTTEGFINVNNRLDDVFTVLEGIEKEQRDKV